MASFIIQENQILISNSGVYFGPIIGDAENNLQFQENTYRIVQITKQDGNRQLQIIKKVLINGELVDMLCASF